MAGSLGPEGLSLSAGSLYVSLRGATYALQASEWRPPACLLR